MGGRVRPTGADRLLCWALVHDPVHPGSPERFSRHGPKIRKEQCAPIAGSETLEDVLGEEPVLESSR